MLDNKDDILEENTEEVTEAAAGENAEKVVEEAEKAEAEAVVEGNAEEAVEETADSDIVAEGSDTDEKADETEAGDETVEAESVEQTEGTDADKKADATDKAARITNVDEIMADVELVMTREINPEEVEAELQKKNKKKEVKKAKKKAAEAAAKADVKPEERRALRRKKRKHDRWVAFVVFLIVLAVIVTGGIVGKGFLQKWLDGRKNAAVTEVVAVTPEVEAEPTPEIIFTPEIIEEPEEPEPEPEEIVPEESPEELFDKMLDEMIAQMPLEDKVAGLFVITPEALTGQASVTKAGDGTKTALEEHAVGGIIYFKSNISSADQLKEMIDNTASYSKYPLFFAVDEEGGDVARVQAGLKLEKTPTANELGKTDDPAVVYSTYTGIGSYLKEYGFNVDFAPVADTLTNMDNAAIGGRAFSTESDVVSKMVPQAVRGLQDAGVSACLKHWPGQGDVDTDTHEGVAITEKTKEEMSQLEFEPFRAGIEAGVDMIMVGHIAAPEITGDNTPCSLSKEVITEILREELDYDGIIITDALNMGAISEYYGADEAAIKALKAGCDMILMPEDFVLAFDGVVNAVKEGTISEERINDCLKRVYRVKYAETLMPE